MADTSKKNKKKSKKPVNGNKKGVDLHHVLEIVQERLEQAKADKDHKLAKELRDQVWVLSDMIRGVRTAISDEQLADILENLPLPSNQQEEAPAVGSENSADGGAGLTTAEKRIRNLKKKLDQVEKLKAKQAAGEKLEKNQLEKIANEDTIKVEIQELQDLLKSCTIGS